MPALIILIIIIVVILAMSLFIVKQQTAAVVERFGKLNKICQAGLNWKIPFIDQISGRISLRILQLNVSIETKTLDNVFVKVVVSVQYFVIKEKITEAFYKLQVPDEQIESYVYDVVRARVPSIRLDDVFETKDDIALAVQQELSQTMEAFGYNILKALVTDIEPDEKVKTSMNQINAAERLKMAAEAEAEAAKIRIVKSAEAEAESKALQGKGIADQRQAIIEGLQESVANFQSSIVGANANDVMNLVLMTQYFDTLKDVSSSSKTNTILMPHSPEGMSNISDQLRQAIIVGNEVNRQSPPPERRPNSGGR